MYMLKAKNFFDLQFLISYLGICPFIYVLLDIIFLNIFSIELLKNFIIFYTFIIISFIGAMRWEYKKNSDLLSIFYGFVPSLFSTILIILNLLDFNKNLIFLFLFIFLNLQLLIDFIFYKKDANEAFFFLNIRIPLTTIIILIIFYLIFV